MHEMYQNFLHSSFCPQIYEQSVPLTATWCLSLRSVTDRLGHLICLGYKSRKILLARLAGTVWTANDKLEWAFQGKYSKGLKNSYRTKTNITRRRKKNINIIGKHLFILLSFPPLISHSI